MTYRWEMPGGALKAREAQQSLGGGRWGTTKSQVQPAGEQAEMDPSGWLTVVAGDGNAGFSGDKRILS
jgi:hypothetical protein